MVCESVKKSASPWFKITLWGLVSRYCTIGWKEHLKCIHDDMGLISSSNNKEKKWKLGTGENFQNFWTLLQVTGKVSTFTLPWWIKSTFIFYLHKVCLVSYLVVLNSARVKLTTGKTKITTACKWLHCRSWWIDTYLVRLVIVSLCLAELGSVTLVVLG